MIYKLITFLYIPILIPHLLVYIFSTARTLIDKDIERWKTITKFDSSNIFALLFFLTNLREFRNLFYRRIGRINILLRYVKPEQSLFINTNQIGGGCYIQHGFATVIFAKSIGENVWINQQVTIGHSGKGIPTIGNNVRICAGAIVVGPIIIGDNVTIGAGAIVVDDIPPNSLVVCPKATIKKHST